LDGDGPWTYHIIQRDANSDTISYTTYDGEKTHWVGKGGVTPGWHHVLGTYDAATGKQELFIDGVSVGTTEYIKTTCKGVPLGIGGIAGGTSTVGNPFNGTIDEVRISRVVRDPKGSAGAPYTVDAETVCLFHFDETEGAPRDAVSGALWKTLPGLFDERGTLNATYDFLERFCDVRWYAPGELGICCPRTDTLTVSYPVGDGPTVRRAPSMEHRWITPTPLYSPGPPERVPARDVAQWKLRMRIGGEPLWICHSFQGYYDRFLKDHPDWFAQGYTGRPPQMCFTNPEFIQQVIQDARDYFDGKGAQPGATAMGDYFGLVPMDNGSWCKCERCQAEMNQAEMKNQQFNNGKASDYIFGFVNKVAREVGKTHPDKWIGALAYSDYAYYPETVDLAPNVLMQLCLHTRNWWCPSMEVNDRKVLNQWRAAGPNRPMYLWLYYNFPALNANYGNFGYFPGYFAHSVVKQMDLYRQANIRGIFMEHSSEFRESYLMDQLEFYVTLKLADDPTLDGDALIDEFFERYYGAAAKPMQALYNRIEDLFSNPKYYPATIRRSPGHQHQTELLAWESLGTPSRMTQMAALMAHAKAAASTPEEKARVALFEKGQWDYMVAGRKRYDEHMKDRLKPPPQVTVPRIRPAGGDVANVDWSRAKDLGTWGGLDGSKRPRKIESRIAHDGQYLYLQLTDYIDPSKLAATGLIWDGDDWEAFFARKRGSSSHRQLCVGPEGAVVGNARGEDDDVWDSGARVTSDTSEPDRWTVEIALPLAKLLPGGAKQGGKLYANLYRARPGASDLMAWAPTFASGFHDTARLAELTLE